CKHVAAVLYGIGARLDERPELLFKLRKVDENELIANAGAGLPLSKSGPAAGRVLEAEGLSELFGIDMGGAEVALAARAAKAPAKPARRKRVARKTPQSLARGAVALAAPRRAGGSKTKKSKESSGPKATSKRSSSTTSRKKPPSARTKKR
ncbi:MAG: hypothetical protein HY698_02710, partial [Deltaproteobacteria bacterium]|nr:hypothetical protein [Deltaproteobacteria bacterium]